MKNIKHSVSIAISIDSQRLSGHDYYIFSFRSLQGSCNKHHDNTIIFDLWISKICLQLSPFYFTSTFQKPKVQHLLILVLNTASSVPTF